MPPERANMPHSKSSCQKTTYRRYRKGAFFFLFPTLLCALVVFGQIQLRKIDGHRHVSELLAPPVATAA